MDKLKEYLANNFSVDLQDDLAARSSFKPYASYFDAMDQVEYLTVDAIVISERIDEYLTLIWDKSRVKVVGFKLKGFKYIFNTYLKELYKLQDEEFIRLISVVESIIKILGPSIMEDANRHLAYKTVLQLVSANDARITDFDYAIAA